AASAGRYRRVVDPRPITRYREWLARLLEPHCFLFLSEIRARERADKECACIHHARGRKVLFNPLVDQRLEFEDTGPIAEKFLELDEERNSVQSVMRRER